MTLDELQGAFIKGGGGPGAFGRMSQAGTDPRSKEEIQTVQGGPSTWSNPTGRVSVQFAPGAVSLFPPSGTAPCHRPCCRREILDRRTTACLGVLCDGVL